ncbi:hypothetical protein [Corynebacterium deserti]|uniref:hypothetical protein n=1 Tax=Corynebacterium deserti TaxID=1408191 RepID=UPI0006AD3704|nr:hypothetical protein [Corynebacterium deserti]
MIDEFALRKDAYHLSYLFLELDQAKIPSGGGNTESKIRSQAGPRDPANVKAISDDAEITADLRSWCLRFAEEIASRSPLPKKTAGGRPLARWVATHAFYIAEQIDADSFHEEIRRWIKQIEKIVGQGPEIKDIAARPEVQQSSKAIIAKLNTRGFTGISPRQLHDWTARGNIRAYPRHDGTNGYLLTEVLEYLIARQSA